jgi:hypothetical protein
VGERFARRIGFWVNVGDIMFVAARLRRGPVFDGKPSPVR